MTEPAAVDLKLPSSPRDELESALALEVLRSERLRATVLCGIFAGAAALIIPGYALFGETLELVMRGAVNPFVTAGCLLGAASYEWLARRRAAEAIRTGHGPAPFWRWVDAALETMLPSLAIVIVGRSVGQLQAVLATPPFVYFILIALSALRLDAKISIFTGACCAVQYLALALIALRLPQVGQLDPILMAVPHHVGKAMLLFLCGAITGLVARNILRQTHASVASFAERNRVVTLFGQHVSPAVVDKLLAQHGDLTETRHVCVMFLDIRDFTTLAEGKRPAEVVAYLNQLWEFMIEIVNANHGIINKFLGDGFMAVFGAPLSSGNDARNAVTAARAILERLAKDGATATRVGIGLHSGEVVTGSIGSPLRREYTIIGDVVNVASRIEQLNKQHGASLLVSDAVYRHLEDTIPGTPLGPLPVKGRAQPVEIFRIA